MTAERRKILVVLAHPDDPEFFAGGTIARWTAEGHEVVYLLATSGDKGSSDPEMTSDRLAALREDEQRAAAAVLGVRQVLFMRYPDGELQPTLQLRRDLTRLIRQQRPDVVLTCDPTVRIYQGRAINHPDHRAIGEATLDAIYPSARDRLTFIELWRDEGLEPHIVREVYLGLTNEPDSLIEVSDTLPAKIAALRQHRSQIKDPAGLEQRIRDRLRRVADDGREYYAEGFRHIVLP